MGSYTQYTTENYPDGNPYLGLNSVDGWAVGGGAQTHGTLAAFDIYPGWNLICIPGTLPTGSKTINGMSASPTHPQFLFNPNWYPFLSKIIGATEASQVIDTADGKQWTGSFTQILPSKGFWLWSDSIYTLPFTFQIRVVYGDDAKIQWGNNNNLVSYPLLRSYSTMNESVLENGAGSATLLTNDKVTQVIGEGKSSVWNGTSDTFVGSLKNFSPFSGYWLKLNNPPGGPPGDNTYGWGDDEATPGTAQQFWKDVIPPPMGTDHPIEDNTNFYFSIGIDQCFYLCNWGARTMDNIDCVPGEDWIASFRGDVCCGSGWYAGSVGATYTSANPTWTGQGTMIPCEMNTSLSTTINSVFYEHSPYYNFKCFGSFAPDEIPTFVIYDYSKAEFQLARIENTDSSIVNMSSYKIAAQSIHGGDQPWRLKGYAKLDVGI